MQALFDDDISRRVSKLKKAFAAAIGLVKPVIPLEEEIQDPMMFQQAQEQHLIAMQEFTAQLEEAIRVSLDTGEMPPGVTGLSS